MTTHKPSLSSMHRRTCLFSGRVQGVGFRYTVQNMAMRFDVGGYVRNLPDGRVEVVMEGADDEMEQLYQSICDRMQGFIKRVDQNETPANGEFSRFIIRH